MPDTLEKQILSTLQLTKGLKDLKGLKIGYRGSSTSSPAAFLNVIKPEVRSSQFGAGNSYGHPTAEARARLQKVEAKVYRTDLSGTVTVTTENVVPAHLPAQYRSQPRSCWVKR